MTFLFLYHVRCTLNCTLSPWLNSILFQQRKEIKTCFIYEKKKMSASFKRDCIYYSPNNLNCVQTCMNKYHWHVQRVGHSNMTMVQNTRPNLLVIGYSRIRYWSGHLSLSKSLKCTGTCWCNFSFRIFRNVMKVMSPDRFSLSHGIAGVCTSSSFFKKFSAASFFSLAWAANAIWILAIDTSLNIWSSGFTSLI